MGFVVFINTSKSFTNRFNPLRSTFFVRSGGEEDKGAQLGPSSEYASMKIVDLKEILRSKGMPTSGTKAVLINRLETSDKSCLMSHNMPVSSEEVPPPSDKSQVQQDKKSRFLELIKNVKKPSPRHQPKPKSKSAAYDNDDSNTSLKGLDNSGGAVVQKPIGNAKIQTRLTYKQPPSKSNDDSSSDILDSFYDGNEVSASPQSVETKIQRQDPRGQVQLGETNAADRHGPRRLFRRGDAIKVRILRYGKLGASVEVAEEVTIDDDGDQLFPRMGMILSQELEYWSKTTGGEPNLDDIVDGYVEYVSIVP